MMKKKVKQYGEQIRGCSQHPRHVLKDFSRMLDTQIEKTVLFMLEQQGLLAGRLATLRETHDALRESYRDVGRDLLQLLVLVELNAISLRKILKKFGLAIDSPTTTLKPVLIILTHNLLTTPGLQTGKLHVIYPHVFEGFQFSEF
ncbi:unnamed protein product [Brassica oleracea]